MRSIATLALGALLWVGVATTAQAQSRFALGLKGGVNQATFYGDDAEAAEYRSGFNGGVFFTYHVSDVFSIQPEVLFSQKGAQAEAAEMPLTPGGEGDVTYDLGYLEIPVLFKLTAPLPGRIQPSLYAGPALAVKLYGEVENEDLDDQVQAVSAGAVVGGEIGFDVGDLGAGALQRVVLDGRYTLGLVPTFDTAGDPSIYNGAFTGSLGLVFGL